MSGHDEPVIIVRRKAHGHGHHGGAWKVAYADFVTAMMAFFLVMWLAAQDSQIRSAVAGYFQDPGLLPHQTSNSVVATGQGGIDTAGMPTVVPRRPDGMLEAEQEALVRAAGAIQQQFSQSSLLSALRDQVEFAVTPEGLRIELVERPGSSFFDTGSATLRPEATRILTIIAEEIGKLPNDVVIEGHTDSRPFVNNERYGNWELSSDRALAARRAMVEHGLRTGQVHTVRGFADNDLRFPDAPLDPRNRRVSIVVRTQEARQLEVAVRNQMGGGG
ncbi:MAG: flagellar motor protein MotB [Vicinamibacterales bacterium]